MEEEKREFIFLLRDDKKNHYDAVLMFCSENTAKQLNNKQIYKTQELVDLAIKNNSRDVSYISDNDEQGLDRRWECIRTTSIRDTLF